MIFIVISFFIGVLLIVFPLAMEHISYERYRMFDNAASMCRSNNEQAAPQPKYEKLHKKALFWDKLNDVFDIDEPVGVTLLATGIAISIVFFITALIAVPVSLTEQSDLLARYNAYEVDYNKWKSGELKEPPYSNIMVLDLQEDIEKKRTFRERHPIMSCYFGHELDDLDCTKFFYDRKYDRIQVDK